MKILVLFKAAFNDIKEWISNFWFLRFSLPRIKKSLETLDFKDGYEISIENDIKSNEITVLFRKIQRNGNCILHGEFEKLASFYINNNLKNNKAFIGKIKKEVEEVVKKKLKNPPKTGFNISCG